MKILWHGVPPHIPTGYGTLTKLFVPAMQELGHTVAINAVCGQLVMQKWRDVIVFPCGTRTDRVGNTYVAQHAARFGADVVISCIDPFGCEPAIFGKLPWYPFAIVDCEPMMIETARALKACRRPIAPCSTVRGSLGRDGHDALYVPFGFDGADYYPAPDRAACRAELSRVTGVDMGGKFVAMMNAANMSAPSRKNFGGALKAWGDFVRHRPDSVLYLHTELAGIESHGMNILRIIDQYCSECPGTIAVVPQYEYVCGMIQPDYLRMAYNAADCLLCTSRGEGFGMPLIEAQACGTPVITPHFGAMAELNFSGVLVEGEMQMGQYSGTEQIYVDQRAVVRALRTLADATESVRADMRGNAVAAVADYEMTVVRDKYLSPALVQIEQELADYDN